MVVFISYENARVECQSHTDVQMLPIQISWVMNDKSYASLSLSLSLSVYSHGAATCKLTPAIPNQSSDHKQWRRAGKTRPIVRALSKQKSSSSTSSTTKVQQSQPSSQVAVVAVDVRSKF